MIGKSQSRVVVVFTVCSSGNERRNLDRSEMSDRDWKIAVVGCGCFHG